jgi:hypothetical protein
MALFVIAVGPVSDRITPIFIVPPSAGLLEELTCEGLAELDAGAAGVVAAFVGGVVLEVGPAHPARTMRILNTTRQETKNHFFIANYSILFYCNSTFISIVRSTYDDGDMTLLCTSVQASVYLPYCKRKTWLAVPLLHFLCNKNTGIAALLFQLLYNLV